MPPFPGFIFGSNPSQSLIADNEQTMNLYVEPIDSAGASTKAALYPTPGFQPQIALPVAGARALFDMAGRTFGVMGGTCYELFPLSGVGTARGLVQEDARLAQIVSNGPAGQLLVASGGHAYLYVLATNVLSLVLAGEATQIGMLDTFFLAFNAATSQLRISGSNDGATWTPTQFVARSQQPDPWRAMIVNPPDIWLFGEQTSDIWYDSGATPFPFVPRTGLSIPYGIAAPSSVAASGGNLFWLAKNRDGAGLVVLAAGYAPVPISTPELNTTIAGYARTAGITDAEGFIYQDAGHVFYVLRFPTARATWVYDLTTKLWAERGKWVSAANHYEVWAPRVRCYSNGLQLTGDATGVISSMDVTFGSETDGSAIRRLRRGPVLVNENKRINLGRFELLDGGRAWGRGRARRGSAGAVSRVVRRRADLGERAHGECGPDGRVSAPGVLDAARIAAAVGAGDHDERSDRVADHGRVSQQ